MDVPRCGARTRSGGSCRNKAGKGTDHVGKGRCKFHGGATPMKHGIYSTVADQRVKELMDELDENPMPLDVTRELNLTRALLARWLERYDDLTDVLIAWNASRGETERPVDVPSIFEARAFLESISRIAYRIERATSDKYIPRGKLLALMQAMGRAVDARVPEDVAELIHEDWLRIELP